MIQDYIKKHLLNKLKENPTLVIYDEKKRYTDIVRGLASDDNKLIEVSGSAITAREEAVEFSTKILPVNGKKRMLIYLPFERPENDQEKIFDPFYVFGLSGTIFPNEASDEYLALCQSCYPEQAEKIDQLFELGEVPDFATIDAVKGGSNYPKLQSVTEEKSEKEIVLSILLPNPEKEKKLKKNKGWVKEYQLFIQATIGLRSTVNTLDSIQEELWRYLLFSEFVFDLPIDLPSDLQKVPRASKSYEKVVLDICERIRNRKYIEETYIAKANQISEALNLEEHFKNARDLGEIVTFAFEDNTYFNNFIEHLLSGDFNRASHLLIPNQSNQIWRDDQNRSAYWLVGRYAFDILDEIQKIGDGWKSHFNSLDNIFHYYGEYLWKLDQGHRYFEKSIKEVITIYDNLAKLITYVRESYFNFWTTLQNRYQALILENGWIFDKTLKNTQLFSKRVAPVLRHSEKVAYFMVDALRFELGKELQNQLDQNFTVKIEPSVAFIPTVTRYAMAALLPDAEKNLTLKKKGKSLEPFLKERHIKGPQDRIAYIKSDCNYGDRAGLVNLDNLLANDIPNYDLLVVTTTEIDTIGESLSQSAQSLIQEAIKKIVKAVHQLEQAGYHKVIMVADHGFVLTEGFQIGDAVSKPSGEWVLQKSRCVGGKGDTETHLMELQPSDIGIDAEVTHFQFLRNYTVFKSGLTYFHEGLSVQENVVPYLEVTLSQPVAKQKIEIRLSYKGQGTGFITTLRPSVEVSSFSEGSLFGEPINIKIEALDGKGNIVGHTAPGQKINPTSGLVEFEPGQAFKVTLAMEEEFEGAFDVVASDPVTGLVYSSIKLKTAYL